MMCLALSVLLTLMARVPASGLKSATSSLANSPYLAPVSRRRFGQASRNAGSSQPLIRRLLSAIDRYRMRAVSTPAKGLTSFQAAVVAGGPSPPPGRGSAPP